MIIFESFKLFLHVLSAALALLELHLLASLLLRDHAAVPHSSQDPYALRADAVGCVTYARSSKPFLQEKKSLA